MPDKVRREQKNIRLHPDAVAVVEKYGRRPGTTESLFIEAAIMEKVEREERE